MTKFNRTLLDSMADGIFIINGDCSVHYWNKTLFEWTGISSNQAEGKNLFDVLPHLNVPRYKKRIEKALSRNTPLVFSPSINNQIIPSNQNDISQRVYKAIAKPLDLGPENESFLLFTVSDVTDLSQSIERIKTSLKSEKIQIEKKMIFLSNMSHEIRTPLSGIIGLTDQLIEALSTDELRNSPIENAEGEFLDSLCSIKECGATLINIINDILDLSKLEAGKFVFQNSSIDLVQFMNKCISVLHPAAERKGLEIFMEIDGELPAIVLVDETRLKQVIWNIVGNAIKYTEQGSIKVLIKKASSQVVDPKTVSSDFLKIEVIDTGVGIKLQDQQFLFDAFTQAPQQGASKLGSTGLGLTITKKFVTLMDGTLSLKSEVGVGSTFSVLIPLRIGKNDGAFKSQQVAPLNTDISILVAEDNALLQKIIVRFLKKLDFTDIHVACDGEQAVQIASKNSFDVIFMDLRMPKMDGISATREILKNPSNQAKIIALTADVLVEDREKCRDAGMIDFLGKPVNREKIIEVLQKVGFVKKSGRNKNRVS